MALGPPKPLYRRRWFWLVVILSGALGGLLAELGLRRGANIIDPVASQWITASPIVRSEVGEIRSIPPSRLWSNVDYGLDGSKTSGRSHYFVHGSKGDLDLLVSWERSTPDRSPQVVQVQRVEAAGFARIWP